MEQGELTLGENCIITNNGPHGIFAIDSTLTMLEDSKIYGNGGGISLQSSHLTMEGGEISENRAVLGGGLYLANHSSAVLKNQALITRNESTGTGIAGRGGGVYVTESTLMMEGNSSITENEGAYHGGGVYLINSSKLEMKGGKISGNKTITRTPESPDPEGGGVALYYECVFEMSGGEISDNIASSKAGGVEVYGYSVMTMSGDAIISGNSAGKIHGGGVFLQENSSFTMESGVIKDNTAAFVGGGVHMDSRTNFTMTGGVIRGNKAREGGGVIKGNTATSSSGGGVGLNNDQNNRLIKKGGTIYGDSDTTHTPGANENTVASGRGHTAYISASPAKYRNDNAGPETLLYAANDGAWTFNDTSPGGVGDTSANWQTAP
jgi:hypothetical protein